MAKTNFREIANLVGEENYRQIIDSLPAHDPTDILGWSVLSDMSVGPYTKNYYLQQMVDCIREKRNYSLLFTRHQVHP